MKLILSPTKTMDTAFPAPGDIPSLAPEFDGEARCLIQSLSGLDQAALGQLFKTSATLTRTVGQMIREFDRAPQCPALFAFQGQAFKTLAPGDFSPQQIRYANENLRILSGLYGVLRPLDRIRPYRLDANDPLKPGGTGLKPFWKKRLIPYFETLLGPDEILVNLASTEYAALLQSKPLKEKTVTLQFRENHQGKLKNLSVRAKQARGWFARHIIQNQITDPEQLKQCVIDGYAWSQELSSPGQWFFVR